MQVSVSPAAPDDVDALAHLAGRTFPLACPPELPTQAITDFVDAHLGPEAFRTHLATAGTDVLCARVAGELVGYALLVAGTAMDEACAGQLTVGPTIGISKFYVDPAHHGAGVAARLLEAVQDLAASRGARGLWLATNVANARARAFYVRHGFVERGGRTFVVGGVPNTDVVYERALTPNP